MIPTAYCVPNERTSPRWCTAFALGCGGGVQSTHKLKPGPVAFWGSPSRWRLLKQIQAEGRDWYYGDHAYFGRNRFYRCTRNAYQHDGSGPGDPVRLSCLGVTIAPWRRSGGHIVLCPPDDVFSSLMGFSGKAWLRNVLGELEAATDRPIVIRNRLKINRPLAFDLADAWCLITYVSNAAVEALCAGVPVICTGPCASSRMGLRDPRQVEHVIRPDGREDWAAALAANQWTINEMREGKLWKRIGATKND